MAGEASSFKLDSELVWRRMGKRRDQLEDASGRIVARVRRGYWRSAFISDPCAPRPIRVATDTREYKTVRRMGVHHLVDTAGDPWVTHTTPGFRRGPIAAGADRDFRYSVSGMLSDPLAASMVIVDDRDRSVLKLRWRTVEPRPVFASFRAGGATVGATYLSPERVFVLACCAFEIFGRGPPPPAPRGGGG